MNSQSSSFRLPSTCYRVVSTKPSCQKYSSCVRSWIAINHSNSLPFKFNRGVFCSSIYKLLRMCNSRSRFYCSKCRLKSCLPRILSKIRKPRQRKRRQNPQNHNNHNQLDHGETALLLLHGCCSFFKSFNEGKGHFTGTGVVTNQVVLAIALIGVGTHRASE